MPWASGATVTGASIATNLDWLFVFGATDAGKNLVSGTSYTATRVGDAVYGSDAVGTYVAVDAAGDRLDLTTDTHGGSFTDTAYTTFVTFTREGAMPAWATLFQWNNTSGLPVHRIGRNSSDATLYVAESTSTTVALDISAITASSEYTVVMTRTGATRKIFYKGGGSSLTVASLTFQTGQIGNLCIGAPFAAESANSRMRAFGRWSRALSDAEAQSMADNPQQIVASAPLAPTAGANSSIRNDRATFSWTDNSSDETSFIVEIETPSGAGNWTAVAGSPFAANTTTTGAITGLTGDTQYRFRVRASNAAGASANSNGTAFYTLPTTLKLARSPTSIARSGTSTVTVTGNNGNAVAGVTLTGTTGTFGAVTNASGQATFTAANANSTVTVTPSYNNGNSTLTTPTTTITVLSTATITGGGNLPA